MAQVVKEWINVEKIEVKDERNLGYPQVLVYFSRTLEALEVSCESNWEPERICDNLSISSDENQSSAFNSVIEALETQLKNVLNSVLVTEKQIIVWQSQMNRSLTALRDMNGAIYKNHEDIVIIKKRFTIIKNIFCTKFIFIFFHKSLHILPGGTNQIIQ